MKIGLLTVIQSLPIRFKRPVLHPVTRFQVCSEINSRTKAHLRTLPAGDDVVSPHPLVMKVHPDVPSFGLLLIDWFRSSTLTAPT